MSVSLEQISEIGKMVGLVAGGLWAAWTFHKLQRARAAELENNAKLAELLRQQPQLDIQLNVAERAPLTETDKSSLCVTVILKNQGEQNLEVAFFPSALTIGRIVFEKNRMRALDIHRFGPSYFAVLGSPFPSDEPQFMDQRVLRVGDNRKMALAVLPIQVPGAYIVQFHALYRKVPFDGEKPFSEAPVQINAIEQTFHFTTGKRDDSLGTA